MLQLTNDALGFTVSVQKPANNDEKYAKKKISTLREYFFAFTH